MPSFAESPNSSCVKNSRTPSSRKKGYASRMMKNRMKEMFAAGEAAFGVSLMFPSPQLVEMVAYAGFDWVLIDCEHGSIGLADVEVMAMAVDSDVPIATATKKNGTFSISLPDGDGEYDFMFRKEGFGVETASLVPTSENLSGLSVTLAPAGEISEAREQAIPVFNEGVTALEAGDQQTALEKFLQASDIDPDFAEASTAAAAIAMELENYAVAAAAGVFWFVFSDTPQITRQTVLAHQVGGYLQSLIR